MGKAQRNANHRHKNSVDLEERAGPPEVKGAELTKDPRMSQRTKVANSPTIIRSSMAKVVTTTGALPKMIVAHHQAHM